MSELLKKIKSWFSSKDDRPLEIKEDSFYLDAINFLNESVQFPGTYVTVFKDGEGIFSGFCIGFGTHINNVLEPDLIVRRISPKIKNFYVVKSASEERIVTLEAGISIKKFDCRIRNCDER